MTTMQRRDFLMALGLSPLVPLRRPMPVWQAPAVTGFPQQPQDLVLAVVTEAHRSLDAVRTAVERYPELAKCAWDWGFGDWETALGAAAHTGQREIAALLLDHGSPPTIFSAAMLGGTGVVAAMIEARPGVQGMLGPHGITLMAHARTGGDAARAVVALLERIGGADNRRQSLPLDAADRLAGRYDASGALLIVELRSGALGIQREGMARRGLTHLGGNIFHPVGAPSVRVRFDEAAGTPGYLVIAAGGTEIRAMRV